MTRKVKLIQIQNVGPNQRATIRLPLGVTYNKIGLFFSGNLNAALLSNIVLKVNGSERQRWLTQAQLQARNSYNGNASDPNVLELDFIERAAKDEAAMTLGAYAATSDAGVQDMTLEFDLGNYVATSASVILAIAEIDVPSKNRLITRTRYFQKVLAGATEEQIIVPSGLNGELLKRIYIYTVLPAAPANGALSSAVSGALAAATYYVRTTWVMPNGETAPSVETSLAVAVNNVLVVAAPAAPPTGALGWNAYVSTATGTETLQNGAVPIALGASWQEPNTGLVAGAALPPAAGKPTLGGVNYVRIRREGSDEYENMTQQANEFFQKTYGKLPQAGLFVVDFTEHNLMGHMLNTSSIMGPNGKPVPVQNLDIRLNVNAAGIFQIFTESVTTNDRP